MQAIRSWSLAAVLAVLSLGVHAQQDKEAATSKKINAIDALQWQPGPQDFSLGSHASIKLPAKVLALSESESDKFLKITGNLPSPGTNVISNGNWWSIFYFSDAGYIKDDEKIDADALLQQIKESDAPTNEERRKLGLSDLITDGWHIPPKYNPQTQNLEWALKVHTSDNPEPSINYTVRILGRSGYESAVLLSSIKNLDQDVVEFRQLLSGFEFKSGNKYSEFRQGDRVAEYGLAALVAGGAAAVAAKTGFWKTIVAFLAAGWKLIAVAAVAVFGGLAKFLKRKGS